MEETVCCVIIDKPKVKAVKVQLEKVKLLNTAFRITTLNNEDNGDHHQQQGNQQHQQQMAIPITFEHYIATNHHDDNEIYLKQQLSSVDCHTVRYLDARLLLRNKTASSQPRQLLVDKIRNYLEVHSTDTYTTQEVAAILSEVPFRWEKHGDLIMLPRASLRNTFWDTCVDAFWETVANTLNARRIALSSRVTSDTMRTPRVALKLGVDGWVTQVDNGVTYTYDVTKCMFSKGNVTEKMRVAQFDCRDEVVVDLFAGIGYFTLPYLVKARAKMLYACEINPDACDALEKNMNLNRIHQTRYQILQGDNRKVAPKNMADRVNLGLIPTSSLSWETACQALNQKQGGWLHVHENVDAGANSNRDRSRCICNDSLNVGANLNWNGSGCTCNDNHSVGANPNRNGSRCICCCDEECVVNKTFKGKRLSDRKRTVWCEFAKAMITKLKSYFSLTSSSSDWLVTLRHIELVKSYAPHVDHVVFDVECRPIRSP